MMVWAKKFYGDEFAAWLPTAHEPLDVTMRLAVEKGIVVLNGSGFDAPEWSIRTSEANLNRDDYEIIGTKVRQKNTIRNTSHQKNNKNITPPGPGQRKKSEAPAPPT